VDKDLKHKADVCRNKNSAALTKKEVLMRSRMSKSRLQKTFTTKDLKQNFLILWHESPGTSVCRPWKRDWSHKDMSAAG